MLLFLIFVYSFINFSFLSMFIFTVPLPSLSNDTLISGFLLSFSALSKSYILFNTIFPKFDIILSLSDVIIFVFGYPKLYVDEKL